MITGVLTYLAVTVPSGFLVKPSTGMYLTLS